MSRTLFDERAENKEKPTRVTKIQTPQEKLSEILPLFFAEKAHEKLAKDYNAQIKTELELAGLNVYSAGGYTAKLTTKTSKSLIEPALIIRLKEMGLTEIVKQREYVDADALENAIYNRQIDIDELQEFYESKSTIALAVTFKENK